jgi:hypothetical protein
MNADALIHGIAHRYSHPDSKTPISDVFQGRASLRYKYSKYLWYLLRFVPCNHALKTRHQRMLLNRDGYRLSLHGGGDGLKNAQKCDGVGSESP